MKTIIFLGILLLLSTTVLAGETAEFRTSLINQVPDPAKAGGIVELWFRIENIGTDEAKNIAVELLPDYPFSLLPDETAVKTIDSLPVLPTEASSKTIRYRIRVDREATSGQYNIKLRTATYWNTAEFEEVLNKTIETSSSSSIFTVYVTSQEVAEIIYLDKSSIPPGKETDLTFTINNIGNSPLSNLEFSWTEPNNFLLPVKSDNVRHIKFLDVAQSIDLTYKVVASTSATTGLYPLNLKLKFDSFINNTIVVKEINTQAGVFIGGETDFKVTFSETTQGQTSLTVANIGSTPALSVSVNIPKQESFNVAGSSSSIIGNLDKGDYTLVTFQINSITPQINRTGMRNESLRNNSFSSDQNLKVIIEYTDTTGTPRSVIKYVPIKLTTSSTLNGNIKRGSTSQTTSFFSTTNIIWISIIVLIVLLFFIGQNKGWWDYKKIIYKTMSFFKNSK